MEGQCSEGHRRFILEGKSTNSFLMDFENRLRTLNITFGRKITNEFMDFSFEIER